MNHRSLVKIHGYIAVFFLPLAVLFAATGALYILGISGQSDVRTFRIEIANGWPTGIEEALAVTREALAMRDLPDAGSSAGAFRINDEHFLWRTLSYWVQLERIGDDEAEVTLQHNSFYRQLVEIHKNHAGPLFSIAGFLFGLGMLVLVVSGAVMMFRLQLYRRAATILLSAGTASCALLYIATAVA